MVLYVVMVTEWLASTITCNRSHLCNLDVLVFFSFPFMEGNVISVYHFLNNLYDEIIIVIIIV